MRVTKIKIKNLFGIKEIELDGRNVEITGSNGVGKTSILDSIRYALTNDSSRDCIIRDGETEGEIIIETDTGLCVDRKKRTNQADFKSVKDGRNIVSSPESFLRSIFSPLQIDPVAFINMSKKEQNRIILDLIDFDWDLNWIKEQFGEIPKGINWEQNILQVLYDIQAESGDYFMTRQDVNRDIRNKRAFISEIAAAIPPKYDAEKWETFDTASKYKELADANKHNGLIERAKIFRDSYSGKMRGIDADMEIAIGNIRDTFEAERSELGATISRLEAELVAAKEKLSTIDIRLADKIEVERSNREVKAAQLEKDMGVAAEYVDLEVIDTSGLQSEIDEAEAMKRHLNEYKRMLNLQGELNDLVSESEELTRKIELARSLPGKILAEATIPVKGLTVVNGVALINGLPVSNLSEGEKLNLCIDVALSKPNNLQIVLIDGVEKLSEGNRTALYKKCEEKGVQFIATRTTNDDELMVTAL
jgi:energy-coupling factor transporter ATP-binding protein EcfA2|uniref:AAA domain protein n=1 Tax=Caudovirales sp. ct1Jx6 TaxID=2826765 RepID=A0A8S5MM53_9CAUD|nr:MAG TPA: AAA domain protein [Caudovirales sp. ct1Jx6]